MNILEEIVQTAVIQSVRNGECLECPAAPSSGGYPRIARTVEGKWQGILVSRAVVALQHGLNVLDTSWKALHSCDNVRCVRAEHLRPGTQRDNMQDLLIRGGRWDNTECPKGHPFPESQYVNPAGKRRGCRICRN